MLKLSERLERALNEQVRLEMEAAYIYRGISQYFSELGTKGFEHWFNEHVKEEIEHAQDFIDFVEEMKGHVLFGALPEVATEYNSIEAAFETAYEHEQEISKSIVNILEIAIEEKNYAAENFLRTYVDEQVEEEDLFLGILEMVRYAGDDRAAIFEVDKILARR